MQRLISIAQRQQRASLRHLVMAVFGVLLIVFMTSALRGSWLTMPIGVTATGPVTEPTVGHRGSDCIQPRVALATVDVDREPC